MRRSLTIFFVADQAKARMFWSAALGAAPVLDVPGMTEFDLPGGGGLGLMPHAGMRRVLNLSAEETQVNVAASDSSSSPAPRAELYLRVPDPQAALERAIAAGARSVSPVTARSWGERAGYCLDPDGHLLAFAATRDRPAPSALAEHASSIDLHAAFAEISQHWSPRVVAELNGQQVRIARLLGTFHWHRHDDEDELFLVRRGRLRIEFRTRTIELGPGELFVVPRGVEHRPVCAEEVEVLLFEPAQTVSTGTRG